MRSLDFEPDGFIGTVDFGCFGNEWNIEYPVGMTANWDLNDDGKVGTIDFSLFAVHWLHCSILRCPPPDRSAPVWPAAQNRFR